MPPGLPCQVSGTPDSRRPERRFDGGRDDAEACRCDAPAHGFRASTQSSAARTPRGATGMVRRNVARPPGSRLKQRGAQVSQCPARRGERFRTSAQYQSSPAVVVAGGGWRTVLTIEFARLNSAPEKRSHGSCVELERALGRRLTPEKPTPKERRVARLGFLSTMIAEHRATAADPAPALRQTTTARVARKRAPGRGIRLLAEGMPGCARRPC
jgi:hypothetical protein